MFDLVLRVTHLTLLEVLAASSSLHMLADSGGRLWGNPEYKDGLAVFYAMTNSDSVRILQIH